MAHLIDADYTQEFLLPPSLEDWIGPGHPARFIREFVDALDLDALGITWAAGEGGRPGFARGLLLKVWLYGYFERVRSTRKLEKACRDNIGFMWLAGLERPDHNTLNGFFRANKAALRALFRQTVAVALPCAMRPNPDAAFHASNFTYDAQRNCCICPKGGILTYRYTRPHRPKGYQLRLYRCTVEGCPHQAACTKGKKSRAIDLNQYYEAVVRQRDKHQDLQARADLAKRSYPIEPVFAFIKHHLGFRRFTVKGLENVRAQWALLCATYNLHKLYRHWQAGRLDLNRAASSVRELLFCAQCDPQARFLASGNTPKQFQWAMARMVRQETAA